MCCIFLLCFLLIPSGVLMDNPLKLLQSNVATYEGGAFFQRVEDVTAISSCTTNFFDAESKIIIELDIDSNEATFPKDFQDKTNLKSRLHSLGSGFCGFKVENVSLNDPTSWILNVTSNGKNSVANFELSIYKIENMDTVKEVTIGSSMEISCLVCVNCGQTSSKIYYCFLYNPKGELIQKSTEECWYFANVATNEDIGDWKCVMGRTPYIKPLEYKITVKTKEIPQHEMWRNETNDYISIGCIIKNISPQTHCIMTLPTGEKLLIQTGSASSRYTSIYTNLQENICAIEIQKPLLDTEIGPWKCEISNEGLFIQVGDIKVIHDVESTTSTVTDLGKSFQINCQVSYSINYCFITSPIGERYEIKESVGITDTKIRPGLGECWLEVDKALPEHNGTWICSFIKKDDVVAGQQKIDVFVRNVIKYSEKVSSLIGNEATMYCNSPRSAVKYCWFISPTGKTYQLTNKVDAMGISYIGDGLEFGECGMKIYNVQEEDVGNWSCVLNIGEKEYVNLIVLDLNPGGPISLAASLGAGIGSSIILLVAMAAVLYHKYRRVPQHTQPNQEDAASDTSSEIVILSEQSTLQRNRADQLPQYTF
ncbi:uncharacterized protein [Onthophagus taurus]|uniref:uncharacterized protein n=1 Tax=Onthophagus taurus TaxID=166361 RepID=UPI0039BE1EFF